MIARCNHANCKKCGKTKSGTQRFRCCDCQKTFTESTNRLAGMRIGTEKAVQIISMLCEGMSVRATARLTDTKVNTILDLLVLIGNRCKRFLEIELLNVMVDDVQIDEVWQYIFCKQKTAERKGWCAEPVGDSYTYTAIERNTKLAVAWHFGHRTAEDTEIFCAKLRVATRGRFQISSDGFGPYRHSVPAILGDRVDFGTLVKVFGTTTPDEQRQYSPAKIIAIKREAVWGQPNQDKICTSHTERANGSMRTFIKRMGRLTYCFSKKWENHEAALGLYFCHYNFCRKHRSLNGQTPAMANGLADHVWTVAEMIENTSNT